MAYIDDDGARFYYCETTKTSVYRHPNEALFQQRITAERSQLAASAEVQGDSEPLAAEAAETAKIERVSEQSGEKGIGADAQSEAARREKQLADLARARAAREAEEATRVVHRKERRAAITLQAVTRRKEARSAFLREKRAVLVIQSQQRRRIAKRLAKLLWDEETVRERAERSRTKIYRDKALSRVKDEARRRQEAEAVERQKAQESMAAEVFARTEKRRAALAAARLQSLLRSREVRALFMRQRGAAIVVQSHQRRRLATADMQRRKLRRAAAVTIQAYSRGWMLRRYRESLTAAVIVVQARARGCAGCRSSQRRREAIVCIQAAARGRFCRRQAMQRRLCALTFVQSSIDSRAKLLSWSVAMEAALEDDATRRAEEQLQARKLVDEFIEETLNEWAALAKQTEDAAKAASLALKQERAAAEASQLERDKQTIVGPMDQCSVEDTMAFEIVYSNEESDAG